MGGRLSPARGSPGHVAVWGFLGTRCMRQCSNLSGTMAFPRETSLDGGLLRVIFGTGLDTGMFDRMLATLTD